jgi:hypothetical protein
MIANSVKNQNYFSFIGQTRNEKFPQILLEMHKRPGPLTTDKSRSGWVNATEWQLLGIRPVQTLVARIRNQRVVTDDPTASPTLLPEPKLRNTAMLDGLGGRESEMVVLIP